MPLSTMAVVMQEKADISQRMESVDVACKDLSQQIAQLSLSLEAQKWMLSEALNKDLAFYAMKNAADRVTIAHHATAAANYPPSVNSQSSSFNNEAWETQPIPQFVFGMEELNKQLQGLLLGSHDGAEMQSSSKWVGVWAQGGAGKTLLVQTAMNNPIVQAHFNSNVYLLPVGRNADALRAQRRLCEKINRSAVYSWECESASEGKTKLYSLLTGKKCLLILDDVWSPGFLEWFDVVSESGSRILLTTRNQPVLERVHAVELRVGLLSTENSMKLLCVHAFNGEDSMPGHLVQLVKSVVAECKGLPLSLKVIGSALAGKIHRHDWEWALQKLRDAEVLNREYEEQLFHRLKLSYDDLDSLDSSRGRLFKECFLYFAAFPEDDLIEAEQIFQLWAGEGFIGQQQTMDAETEAWYVLGVLVGRSLVEVADKMWSFGRNQLVPSCKIHDVLRDLGLYILQKGAEEWEQKCLFKAGWQPNGQENFPQSWLAAGAGAGAGGNKSIMQARKLSLMGSRVSSLPSNIGVKSAPLQVLLLGNSESLAKIDGAFLGSFTDLRVLDLSHTKIVSLPKALGKLSKLVVLSLERTPVQSLPASIGRLTKLEQLNLQGCGQLTSVPKEGLSKLVSLKILNTRGCANMWDRAADSSGFDKCINFVNKQFCCGGAGPSSNLASNTSSNSSSQLEALGSLVELRKLWIGSTVQEALPGKAMGGLVKLRLISVYFQKLKELPEELRALTELESLDLNTCLELEQLPEWVPQWLTQLRTLDLRSCRSLRFVPAGLSHLQRLTKLELSECGLQLLPDDFFGHAGAFLNLEELWLFACRRLEAFPNVVPGALPRLTILNLFECASLKSLPESFEYLGPKLRLLNLGSCWHLTLPSDRTFAAFIKLEELTLKNTPLKTLPQTLLSLPALQKLDISECSLLESLPGLSDDAGPGLSGLTGESSRGSNSPYFPSLQELVASNSTGLTNVPVSILKLPRLKMLNVSGCDKLVVTEDLRRAVETSRRDLQIKGLVL